MGSIDNNGRIELKKIIELSRYFNIFPTTFIEIGSHTGNDAKYIKDELGIAEENIYILEAHPVFYKQILQKFPQFQTFHLAAWHTTEEVSFFATSDSDDGRSSVKNRDIYEKSGFIPITVSATRMDEFIDLNNIKTPSIVKIDVEGAAHEVLEGFGSSLSEVGLIQVETEQRIIWEEQKTKDSVFDILTNAGFSLAWQVDLGINQNDSIWINNKHFREKR